MGDPSRLQNMEDALKFTSSSWLKEISSLKTEDERRENIFFTAVEKKAIGVGLSPEETKIYDEFNVYLSKGEVTERKFKWIVRYQQYLTSEEFIPFQTLLNSAKEDPMTEAVVRFSLQTMDAVRDDNQSLNVQKELQLLQEDMKNLISSIGPVFTDLFTDFTKTFM